MDPLFEKFTSVLMEYGNKRQTAGYEFAQLSLAETPTTEAEVQKHAAAQKKYEERHAEADLAEQRLKGMVDSLIMIARGKGV